MDQKLLPPMSKDIVHLMVISITPFTRYLKDFKVTRGKWNLKVTPKKVAEIERSF